MTTDHPREPEPTDDTEDDEQAPLDWRNDPDDPGNRLMLQPRCPECGEPAYQLAWLDATRSPDEWECGDCGHVFRESGWPHPKTTEEWAFLADDDWETDDEVGGE